MWLITKAYGEFDLENYCKDNIECEENEHQIMEQEQKC